jgi:hypothetical protein
MQIFKMTRTQTTIPNGPKFTYQVFDAAGKVIATSGHSNEYVAAVVRKHAVAGKGGRGSFYSAANFTSAFENIGKGVDKNDESIIGVAIVGRPALAIVPKWITKPYLTYLDTRPEQAAAAEFTDAGPVGEIKTEQLIITLDDGRDVPERWTATVRDIVNDDESQCRRGTSNDLNGNPIPVLQFPGMSFDAWQTDDGPDDAFNAAVLAVAAAWNDAFNAAALAVAAAWNDAGRVPAYHERAKRAKQNLQREWRTLANAVERLAKLVANN